MNTLTAIELGTKTLAAVMARVNGKGLEILKEGWTELSTPDVTGVRAALDRCGVDESSRRQGAVLLIPRGQALLRDIELPEGTPEELIAMVRFQVEREMPLPVDQVRYTYSVVARAEGKVRVQVAAVPRDILDPAVAALEGAGVRLAGAYVSSFGLLSLYSGAGPAALIEVSGGEVEIMVASAGRMEFSRTAPLAEGLMVEAVAQEIDRTMLAWSARSEGREIKEIILAGKGEGADRLAQGLTTRLAREIVQIGHGGLETATAAGLCAGLLRGDTIPDLLHPPTALRKLRFTRTHWTIGAAALGVILLLAWSRMVISWKQDRLDKIRVDLKQLEPLAAEVAQMSRQTTLAQQWYRDRYPWIQMFDALRKPIDRANLWILTVAFEETGAVRIAGKMRDSKHVTDFVGALSKTGQFSDIKIEKMKPTSDKGEYRNEFIVTARRREAEARKGI